MYYSNGNYEAFAHPRKPEGVDNKSAYLVGSGLAALSAAPAMGSRIRRRALSSAAAGKWKITLNVCGICSVPFRP